MTSIYPVIRKLKIMCCIVYETQSMIHCADIPHGFAKGGLHPTLQGLDGSGTATALNAIPTGHAQSGGQAFFLMNSDYRGLFVVRAR